MPALSLRSSTPGQQVHVLWGGTKILQYTGVGSETEVGLSAGMHFLVPDMQACGYRYYIRAISLPSTTKHVHLLYPLAPLTKAAWPSSSELASLPAKVGSRRPGWHGMSCLNNGSRTGPSVQHASPVA